ncbi:uncharacterized protein RSE6_07630 [Rhynchosporium secalis]|uniref:Uncharacterized protein n=1 Tax=Rhynchosporium secalis TaxID=38038 RepID=A0A1E1MDB4_RHYSE|nr:uncharacterized protein RSE6_07630 [Rhynchosporium secalis]
MEQNRTSRSSAQKRSPEHRSRDETLVSSAADRNSTSFLEHKIALSGMSTIQNLSYRSSSTRRSISSSTTAVDQRLRHSYSFSSGYEAYAHISYRTSSEGRLCKDHQDREILYIGAWVQEEKTFDSGIPTTDISPRHESLLPNFDAHIDHQCEKK